VIIYHCVPKAARRFLATHMMRAFPAARVREIYEPMQLDTPQTNKAELSLLFDPADEPIQRFDHSRLQGFDFCFGAFSTRRFHKEPGDYSFTFLRHPVERFYSAYYYAHHHITNGTEAIRDGSRTVRYRQRFPEMVELFGLDLERYVERFIEGNGRIRFNRGGTIFGPIDEIFHYPTNLDVHDFVGIVEHMPQSLGILNDHLGTAIADGERLNKGPVVKRERIGEGELTRLFARDIETFHQYESRLVEGRW
jgi:hypothetical protein